MDYSGVALSLFDKLSIGRESLGLSSLLSVGDDDSLMQNVFSNQTTLETVLDIDNLEVSIANLESELDTQLTNSSSGVAKVALESGVTHADVKVTEDDDILRATITVYCHYLELEPVGQMIDGDLVVQGLSIRDNYGPAFCTLEYAPSMGDPYTEIGVVAPWSFMLTASEGNETTGDVAHKAAQFVIPVSVDTEYRDGIIRMQIYVDQADKVPYDEEPIGEDGECSYDMKSAAKRASMICAVSLIKQSTPTESSDTKTSRDSPVNADGDGERSPTTAEGEPQAASRRGSDKSHSSQRGSTNQGDDSGRDRSGRDDAENDEILAILAGEKLEDMDADDAPGMNVKFSTRSNSPIQNANIAAEALLLDQAKGVITDIRIASDYDDVMALQAEGYELHCTHVSANGVVAEQEHLWRFHVMATYGNGNETTGLEDITWVRCLKSLGTLPTVPLFQILHDYDLSDDDDDYAIYLAYKVGPNPRFKRMVMLSCTMEDEKFLTSYINAFTAVFRAAPASVAKTVGGPSGIFLMVDGNPVHTTEKSQSRRASQSHRESPKTRHDGDSSRISSPGGGDAGSDDEGDGRGRGGGESDVDEESDDDDYGDAEEQLASMMQRIDELQNEKNGLLVLNSELQKKAVALIAREKAMQGQTAAARTAAEVVATIASENPDAVHEQNVEKEKQYQDTLQLIVDERHKLNKQLKEFDQLALDLQTRLDDKELKANGIQSSFKQFKKEILAKAENSRTGHGIPHKQVAQFEVSELKHEEDLERVRLRNISLRTTFRKLERTLRAREQLAEGLHMIDFEQLKIENQTLNEKIEERNEELAKLKRKKTTTVQVLTHIREKLRFVEQANENLAEKLAHLENCTTELRNIVTSDKLYRDDLRAENKELRAKQGFATSDLLLVDYEQRCNEVERLKAAATELKDRYGILQRQVNRSLKTSTSTPWVMSNSNVLK